MNVIRRNNILIKGNGSQVIMFAHGFGCNQNMWRYIAPAFEDGYKIVLFDQEDVRPSQHGLGLGLYICSEIARAHNGSLNFISTLEETCFTFRMDA